MNVANDRIAREILLKTSPSTVWEALADAEQFGDWFGVALHGKSFIPGQRVRGMITHAGFEHIVWEVLIERMDPERLMSFRWHPYAIDPSLDYSSEFPTLVEFKLQSVGRGTLLTLVESGFGQLPKERRAEAYRMNSQGWDGQLRNIQKHLKG